MKKILFLFALLLITNDIYAQAVEAFSNYISEAEKGRSISVPVRSIVQAPDLKEGLEILSNALSNESEDVRALSYRMLASVGYRLKDSESRVFVVNKLTNGLKDKSSGIIGMNTQSLAGFKVSDFDAASKKIILRRLQRNTPHFYNVVKLAGYVQPKGIERYFKAKLKDRTLSEKNRWAIHIAQARIGDKKARKYVYKTIRDTKIGDNEVYSLLPSLIYIKTKEAVKILGEVVLSDEKNCLPADPDSNVRILCGYRVMEYMGLMLENFPYEMDGTELATNDYEQALIDIREWLKKKPRFKVRQGGY